MFTAEDFAQQYNNFVNSNFDRFLRGLVDQYYGGKRTFTIPEGRFSDYTNEQIELEVSRRGFRNVRVENLKNSADRSLTFDVGPLVGSFQNEWAV